MFAAGGQKAMKLMYSSNMKGNRSFNQIKQGEKAVFIKKSSVQDSSSTFSRLVLEVFGIVLTTIVILIAALVYIRVS